ncbi:MAG TPA: WD40 repeat domain-containing protein [Chthonomonadaceae bacterium]|nr:WD40 repeat domain-containing protein [Chthonomonadaceae bacterium]
MWTIASQAQPLHATSQPRAESRSGSISAAAFAPKGDLIALGRNRSVTLQNVLTGRIVATLPGHAGVVTSLAFSPNGALLAAAGGIPGKSGEIKLWDVRSAKLLLTLSGPVDVIYGAVFRGDGRQIAGGSYDHSVTLWDVPEHPTAAVPPRSPSARLRDHTDAVYAVAYSPDGTYLASAGGDRTVKVWEMKTGKRLYTLSESTAELYALAFRPDGKQLAAGGVDKALRVWNIGPESGVLARAAFAHEAAILRVAYTHDGKSLLTSGEDNAVKRWNADTLDEAKVYPRQSDWPQGLAVCPHDDRIAVGCHDGSFALYDLSLARVLILPSVAAYLRAGAQTVGDRRSRGVAAPRRDTESRTQPVGALTAESRAQQAAPLQILNPFDENEDATCFLPALAPPADAEFKQDPNNGSPGSAQPVTAPASIHGTLWNGTANSSAPVHYYRFSAKRGLPLVVDVMARRAGSPLDSAIAICDLQGRPVERALLRAVGQTEVTLFDRDSVSPGIRLILHPDLHLNDYVLIGREVLRIAALPKGPDDDYQFRSYRGQRVGYLGTTPEYHSIGAAVYKVEIYPPGRTFSPNGMPLTHLTYENDDGGPLYGRDSYLEFSPPADGDYLVRITDARGQQGEKFTYRLNIHPPRPDFKIVSNPASPTMTKGSGETITVECERYEGYNGEIAVRLEDLPPGFTATQTVIEAGENSASLLVTAASNTETPKPDAPGSYRVVATARINGQDVTHTIEPDEKNRRLKVNPAANVAVTTDITEVTLHPGQETLVEARIERRNQFGGRVPVDVRNLPFGVKVLDVGLNGVLITEKETSRKFVLYCEPWVQPQSRPIYVLALPENQGSAAAPPLLLTIR